MRFLRTKLFVVLVALLAWGGYAENVLHLCELGEEHQTELAGHEPGEEGHHENDGCHCTCHLTVTSEVASPVLTWVAPVAMPMEVEAGVFPPDAVPLGIDHPPRLA